ncbi:hypothetical protein [Phaeovulum sp.]|uniref:hypothetical protein n=1 Tax=Phaeovulum sp. TaxID=2934796 RepID=UPI0039E38AF2
MALTVKSVMPVICGLLLAGCTDEGPFAPRPSKPGAPTSAATAPMIAPSPKPSARTVEEFDTTSPEQRAAARAKPSAQGGRELGRSIASLGDPTEPGFWVRSPLVKVAGKGRIVDAATGTSVQVDLIPLPGDAGAGSQVSLPALRLLGVPLTALPEVIVYAL